MDRLAKGGSSLTVLMLLLGAGCGMGDAGARGALSGEDAGQETVEDSIQPGPPPITEVDRAALEQAAVAFVHEETAIEDVGVEVEVMAEGWARARVVPPGGTTDPATLYMRLEDGQWSGVVIGTAFTPEDLDEIGVPAAARPRD